MFILGVTNSGGVGQRFQRSSARFSLVTRGINPGNHVYSWRYQLRRSWPTLSAFERALFSCYPGFIPWGRCLSLDVTTPEELANAFSVRARAFLLLPRV